MLLYTIYMQIIVENLLVNYEDQGTGKTILFLHGWGSNLKTFDFLASTLKTQNRVILLDFPGFGKSQTPKTPWNLEDYSRFVQNFLKKINLESTDLLIAHSFGCRVAIKILGLNLMSPKQTLLLGPAGIRHSNSFKNLSLRLISQLGKIFFRLPLLSRYYAQARNQLYTNLNSTDYLNLKNPVMRQIFQNTINEDLKYTASKIHTPVHFLMGEQDTTVPPKKELPLAKSTPNATFEILKNAGHYPHTDNPKHVLNLINTFLNA